MHLIKAVMIAAIVAATGVREAQAMSIEEILAVVDAASAEAYVQSMNAEQVGDVAVFRMNCDPWSDRPKSQVLQITSKQILTMDMQAFIKWAHAAYRSGCYHSF